MTLRDDYLVFAERDAAPTSPRSADWARGVADEPDLLASLELLPHNKQHPTLPLAALRALGAPNDSWSVVSPWAHEHWDDVLEIVRTRWTQTNEAARCATLLLALSRIPGPVALLEVGASAGLCLYPDRYSYAYTGDAEAQLTAARADDDTPVLSCALTGLTPPTQLPEVVWRAGIDRNPLHVASDDDMRWLDSLVWPEHEDRRRRLYQAARVAASDPPRLFAGDVNDRLDDAIDAAPAGATVVVFHTAVMIYLEQADRDRFRTRVRERDVRWISVEGTYVWSDLAAGLPAREHETGDFILALDGEPLALASPHGRYARAL